jgi:hypothetical protein
MCKCKIKWGKYVMSRGGQWGFGGWQFTFGGKYHWWGWGEEEDEAAPDGTLKFIEFFGSFGRNFPCQFHIILRGFPAVFFCDYLMIYSLLCWMGWSGPHLMRMAPASTISVQESAAAGRWASTLVRPNHAHANLQLIGFTNTATFAFLQNYALFRIIFE